MAHPHREGFRVKAEPASEEGLGSVAAAIRLGSGAIASRGEESMLFVAPAAEDLPLLATQIARSPALRSRIIMTTPAAIRRMLISTHARPLAADAVNRLARSRPDLSARSLVTPRQAILLAALLGLGGLALVFGGWTAAALFDIAAGLLFLCLTLLRIMAFGLVADRARHRPPAPPRLDPESLPVYTILLPLHDEPHMIEELVAAMNRLVWPRERLDIKLILEARDARTIAAAAALRLSAPYEVVIVPPVGPRTKPKALAFALPLARGDYVTVYDAEDRPDPLQLVEAHLAFLDGADDLACLQAPLLIDNAGTNGLTALFALEYSVQFDGVLPLLAALGLPLPLGGTSNHFRRAALERVGGWDPYNVTEDADLGIRLARFGYRTATLERPTLEEGPRSAGIWLRQRTRWLKGWMQTVIVHLRAPRRLLRDLGPKRFAGFILVALGSLVAAAVHPVYLATVAVMLVDPGLLWRTSSPALAAMTMLNLVNFVAAYGVFALLSRQTFLLRGMKLPAGALLYLPGYWLLMSLAFCRAFIGLVVAPHHWAKTPHVGRRSTARATPSTAISPVTKGHAVGNRRRRTSLSGE